MVDRFTQFRLGVAAFVFLGGVSACSLSQSKGSENPPSTPHSALAPRPQAVDVQTDPEFDNRGLLSALKARLIANSAYCNLPNPQAANFAYIQNNKDQTRLGVGLRVSCTPQPTVNAEVDLALGSSEPTRLEDINLPVAFGDTIYATLQRNQVGDWQAGWVNETQRAQAESKVYRLISASLQPGGNPS